MCMLFKNVMFLVFILQAGTVSAKNEQQSQFTGLIYAVSESRTISNRNIIYTINDEAIQRIEYQSDKEFRGLIAYPANDEIVLFVRSHSKKYYSKASISEYLSRFEKYKNSDYADRDKLLGRSKHFKKLYYSDYVYKLDNKKSVVYLGQSCNILQYSRPVDGFRDRYDVVYCDSLNIPRQWLNLTDGWVDDDVTGFPFQVKNYSTDEDLINSTMIKNDEKNNNTNSSEGAGKATLGAVWGVAKQGFSVMSRGLHELGENNYSVTKVVATPISEKSFIDLSDYIEIKTIDDFQRSLSHSPEINNDNRKRGSRFTW